MDISINGPKILGYLGPIPITQTIVISWVVLAIVTGLCIWLGHNLQVENISKRQALAEMAVEKLNGFVHANMGETGFDSYIPLVGAIFATSVVSNLIGLFGVFSPTADLSTEAAWALVVFVLITRNKLKAQGIPGYLKGFLSPIFVMAPLNVISELATPVSMACRHFGNILSGMVITLLIYGALTAASSALFGLLGSTVVSGLVLLAIGVFFWMKKGKLRILGGVLGFIGLWALLCSIQPIAAAIPVLNFGLPAILSLYFDWFSGLIQAFIFCTLTTIFIKSACEA